MVFREITVITVCLSNKMTIFAIIKPPLIDNMPHLIDKIDMFC